jgi:AmmeMemoRadiSam system protein A
MDKKLAEALLRIARESIAEGLGLQRTLDWSKELHSHSVLSLSGAVFVTLTIQGELRGCIGSLQAHRSLGDDCRRNAYSAAFEDPRFPALNKEEFEKMRIEVSILSKPSPLPCSSEKEAIGKLRPGLDGVILEWQGYRATYLPQVWEQLPIAEQFLRSLKRKAGLPVDFWAPDLKLQIYQVEHVEEP